MIKRIFMLSEDFDGTLAAKIEEFNKDGARVSTATVDLSRFSIFEEFFAPAESSDGSAVRGAAEASDETKSDDEEKSLGEQIQDEIKEGRKEIRKRAGNKDKKDREEDEKEKSAPDAE